MVSSLNPNAQQFLDSFNRITNKLQQTQIQISSGLRVNQVSDAPDSISTLLAARANLSTVQQIGSNLARFKAEADGAEQALQGAVRLFDQVQTLGATGDTDTATTNSRSVLAQQLGSILEQMGGLAATQIEGRYVFSGDSDQQAPYIIDLTQTNPVSPYAGSAATRVAQHPDGTTFAVSETGQAIFDSPDPTTNVFSAIVDLRAALANNDRARIQTAVGGLDKVSAYLNAQLAFYGRIQHKIAQATDYGQNLQSELQSQISGLQDTDMTSAILELQQSQTQEQAALQSRALIPRSTLFD